jgi:hypothetical protein
MRRRHHPDPAARLISSIMHRVFSHKQEKPAMLSGKQGGLSWVIELSIDSLYLTALSKPASRPPTRHTAG